MADNLPVIKTHQELAGNKPASSTLLGRGLAAILLKQITFADHDKRYRQARDIYDQITDFGREHRFDPDLLPKKGRQRDMFEDYETSEIQPWINKTNQLAQVFRELKQLADEGYGKAFFPLALMYQGGQGIMQDVKNAKFYGQLAFNWCVANQSFYDPELWTDLGWMYDHEIGVEADEESMFYFLHYTELDHSNAPFNVWEWYETKWVREDDGYRCFNLAMLWYRKAADQGYERAQYNVGFAYLENPYSEQDFEVAALWFKEAADQGFYRAQRALGNLYETGLGVEQDYDQAAFWYRKAAEQGDEYAQLHLAELLDYKRDDCESDEECKLIEKEIFYWYRMAAEQGFAKAHYELGFCFQYGVGVEPDSQHAMYWYLKASEQGNTQAQVTLGGMLSRGHGSDEHEIKYQNAFFWFQKAAEKNDPYGQWELGICYWFGRGVKQNVDHAIYCFREAVKQGYPISLEEQKRFGIENLMDE